MLIRTLVSIVGLVAVGFGILLQFLFPHYQLIIFYIVLIWIFAQLFVFRLPVMSRRIGTGPSTAPPPPLPSGRGFGGSGTPVGPPAGTTATDLGFCVYCGANVAPGTAICPSCGRTLPIA